MSEIKIKEKFKHLTAFLVGTPKQFLIVAGKTYCVREGCEECPYFNNGCESGKEVVPSAMIPPARRAIGLEETPFLVLRLLPGKEFRKLNEGEENPDVVPLTLWNNPRDYHSLDERNLHFILSDRTKKFRVLKGQFRFYGSRSEFENSEYAQYFKVYSEYKPQHHIVAFDFSAVEPKGSTICTKQREWLEIFNGTPKVIVKKVSLKENPPPKDPKIFYQDTETFCILLGELDKVTFEDQCLKCNYSCKVLKEYSKNIPGDWHSLNTAAFMPEEYNSCFQEKEVFVEVIREVLPEDKENNLSKNFLIEKEGKTYCTRPECNSSCPHYSKCNIVQTLYKKEESEQEITFKYSVSQVTLNKQELPTVKKFVLVNKDKLSELRGIGKIVGLALTYGCSAYTIMTNTGLSLDESEKKKNNFFSRLDSVKKHMLYTEQRILNTGISRNFFGRICDVSRWAFSKAESDKERRKDIGYAVRIGYNHPIQSSMAECLKISMLRIDDQIRKENWSPLYGVKMPQNILPYVYTDLICHTLLSIHDELDFLLLSDRFDALIPQIYRALQIRDIIKSLGVDFSLEMDVEYDHTRSFTSTAKYSAAKIHLLDTVIPSLLYAKQVEPNMAVVEFEEIEKNFSEILNFLRENYDIVEGKKFLVGVKKDKELFVFPNKISEEVLRNFPGKWQAAFYPED